MPKSLNVVLAPLGGDAEGATPLNTKKVPPSTTRQDFCWEWDIPYSTMVISSIRCVAPANLSMMKST